MTASGRRALASEGRVAARVLGDAAVAARVLGDDGGKWQERWGPGRRRGGRKGSGRRWRQVAREVVVTAARGRGLGVLVVGRQQYGVREGGGGVE